MGHLFFSYARKDSSNARIHVERMRAEGFIIWQDVSYGEDGIPPGADSARRLNNAITAGCCDGMILQWSAAAAASQWVAKEIAAALQAGKAIYPLRLDDTPLPPSLSHVQYVSVAELSSLMDHLEKAAPHSKRNIKDVPADVPLGLVSGAKAWERPLGGVTMVSVPLLESSYTLGYVVGGKDECLDAPKRLLLCPEFTGSLTRHFSFLSQAILFYRKVYENEPCIALYIRPKTERAGKFLIDDHNYAEWMDAVDSCVAAVHACTVVDIPEVHIFAKAPVAFGVLLGTRFPTGTRLFTYNDIQGAGDATTYSQVGKVVTR